MTDNQKAFTLELSKQFVVLFSTPMYTIASKKFTPEAMADKVVSGLLDGTADKSGQGVVNTCKLFNIKLTYKAINEFLKG